MDRFHGNGVIEAKACVALTEFFTLDLRLLYSLMSANGRGGRFCLGRYRLGNLTQMELARVVELNRAAFRLRPEELVLGPSKLLFDF